MKVFLLVATAGLWALAGERADAVGFHFQTRGVHVDVGHPHGGYHGGHYGGHYGGHRGHYHSGYGGYYGRPHASYYGGWGHGHSRPHVWHDTSHYDYHPGGYVRHYNHYDYVPGHYDYHHEGHWDH